MHSETTIYSIRVVICELFGHWVSFNNDIRKAKPKEGTKTPIIITSAILYWNKFMLMSEAGVSKLSQLWWKHWSHSRQTAKCSCNRTATKINMPSLYSEALAYNAFVFIATLVWCIASTHFVWPWAFWEITE